MAVYVATAGQDPRDYVVTLICLVSYRLPCLLDIDYVIFWFPQSSSNFIEHPIEPVMTDLLHDLSQPSKHGSPCDGLMLGQRCRRWTNIKPAKYLYSVFAGKVEPNVSYIPYPI